MTSLRSIVSVLFQSADASVSLYKDDADVLAALEGSPRCRRPTDLVWTPDGHRFVVAIGPLVEMRETTNDPAAVIRASTPAGALELTPAKLPFQGVRAQPASSDLVSAAFGPEGKVTVAADGACAIDGHTFAEIERATRVRLSTRSTLAIVAEHEGGSRVHLFSRSGGLRAVVECAAPLGGVAWSPDDERLVVRSAGGLAIHDPDGGRLDEIVFPDAAPPTSGAVAWTRRGLFGLSGPSLVHAAPGGPVRTFAGVETAVGLAAMDDGPYVAVTTTVAARGLAIADLATGDIAPVDWVAPFFPSSPISFSPSGGALIWADAVGVLVAVPIGPVEVDARGEAVDRDKLRLEALAARLDGSLTDAELRALGEELSGHVFRSSLQSRLSALRASVDSRLRDRRAEATKKSLFKPPPPAAAFAVGDRVKHAKFGEGPVTAVDGSGDAAKITVDFEGGPKSLRASFLARA